MSKATNPFEPPKADWDRPVEQAEEGIDYFVNASRSTRLVNSMLDTLFMSLIALVMGGEDWAILIFFAYYISFETFLAKTPAKWITQTRVITKSGRRPRFMQILGRTLTRWVPFEAFSFLGPKGRGWHDTWSGTRVVRDSRQRGKKRRRHK